MKYYFDLSLLIKKGLSVINIYNKLVHILFKHLKNMIKLPNLFHLNYNKSYLQIVKLYLTSRNIHYLIC